MDPLTVAEAEAAPALELHPNASPPKEEPGTNQSIKAMADRFRALAPKPETKEKAPDPGKMAPEPKMKAPEPKAEPKAEPEPNPQPLPGREGSRETNLRALAQARDEFKKQADAAKLELETTNKRLKALEEEYGGLKKTLPGEPSAVQKALQEREQLVKDREELINQIEAIKFEASPRFQQWCESETEKHLKVALRQIPADQRDKARDLLLKNPAAPELEEILEPLTRSARTLVEGAMANLERFKIEREEALAKGAEKWRELQSHEQSEQAKAQEARKSKMAAAAEKAITHAKVLDAFRPIEGNQEHNDRIAEREAFVRAVVAGEVDEDVALALPGAAVQYLHLKQTVVPALEQKLKEQAELIKQLQQASPSLADGHSGTSGGEEDATPGSAFASAVRKAMGRK